MAKAARHHIDRRVNCDRHFGDFQSIGDNEPLRLAVAAAYAFPDGSMTISGLRREEARGRLLIERIAGKDYTTLGAIKEMRERCRNEVKGHPDYQKHAVTALSQRGGQSLDSFRLLEPQQTVANLAKHS